MTYPKQYLYKRIVEAKLFIDEHFRENIDVSQIAAEANYSKYHFIRLFKDSFGDTPRQYLIKKRLDYAKKLLQHEISVTSTCLESGFTSLGYFSTLFKNTVGISPSSYAEAHRNRRKEIKQQPAKFIPGCYIKKSNFQEADE